MLSRWFKSQSSSSLVLLTNFLEFLDVYLFIHFGWLITKIFLPGWPSETAKILSLISIYGIAPLSCMFFAYLGDLYGRKPILLNTAILMGIASFSIVFLPESWGWGLIALRVLQGIAMGGEPMAAYLFVMEEKKDMREATFYVFVTRITEGLGGLLALGVGFLVIVGLGEEYWRLLFAITSVFIAAAFVVRKVLHETKEYQNALSNERIPLYDRAKIKELYQARESSLVNQIAGFMFWLSYPIGFTICYLHIGSYICHTRLGLEDSAVILCNAGILCGEVIFSFLLSYLVIYLTSVDMKRFCFSINVMGLLIAFFALWNLDNLSIEMIYASQIAMMVLINYGWVFPELFKGFSVIGRYTNMGGTWAVARLASFVTCIFYLDYLIKLYGLGQGSAIALLSVNLIAMTGLFIMTPYSTIRKNLAYE